MYLIFNIWGGRLCPSLSRHWLNLCQLALQLDQRHFSIPLTLLSLSLVCVPYPLDILTKVTHPFSRSLLSASGNDSFSFCNLLMKRHRSSISQGVNLHSTLITELVGWFVPQMSCLEVFAGVSTGNVSLWFCHSFGLSVNLSAGFRIGIHVLHLLDSDLMSHPAFFV